jgi:uncharacterized protein YjdB
MMLLLSVLVAGLMTLTSCGGDSETIMVSDTITVYETDTITVYETDTITVYQTDTIMVSDTVVLAAPAVSVTGDVAVMVGESTTFTASTENGTDAGYDWTSSDDTIATVDETGLVAGVAAGTAIISAVGVDSGAMGTWGVHVYDAAVVEPMVMVSGVVGLMVGLDTTLVAETVNGTDAGYDWSSSDDGIATVDGTGIVTAVAMGDVTFTATGIDTAVSGSWSMFIYDAPVVTPFVTVTGDLSIFEGEDVQLTAVTTDGVDTGYDWTSSDDTIATVSEDGLVTGLVPGEVIVTATGLETAAFAQHGVVIIEQGVEIPFEDLWAGSGHADATAEAFVHWDDDGEIQTSCAKCHSTTGYLDFLGVDGTDFGTVDTPAPIGTVVTCAACHNTATQAMDSVAFPSGKTVNNVGSAARCMQCHQGRSSTPQVNDAIDALALADVDTASDDLGFKNVHYFAAGATLYGNEAMGGFQYDGKIYDNKFVHMPGLDSCNSCHNVHSLEVKTDSCAACHEGDVEEYRMAGSYHDYDGDGDTEEGLKLEIEGLEDLLYLALQDYALNTLGTGILYDAHSYPYFFIDSNGNGVADDGEIGYSNSYGAFSPRLLKGAYNYQYSLKDPGGFAHNGKYIIALLYDSIEDLGGDVSALHRADGRHFNGASEAFRHWDNDEGTGTVPASCARCHSAEGFEFYADNSLDSANPVAPTDGMTCAACHTGEDLTGDAPRKYIPSVTFPSGVVIENDSENPDDSFMCMSCHQGRASMLDVDAELLKASPSFKNVHYLPTGVVLLGKEAGVAYQYGDDDTYAGKFGHFSAASAQCTYCHTVSGEEHSFHVELAPGCAGCHDEASIVSELRKNRAVDYNGNGDVTETLAAELLTLADAVYAQMQVLAADAGNPLIYDSHAYPYLFKDTNANGDVDDGEANYGNKYSEWTPALLKASFNFQLFNKEPGAWAHNSDYMAQLLIDTLVDLGVDVTGYNRP